MIKQTFLITFLFYFITCVTYAPWHLKQFEFSVSDMCSFEGDISNFLYVKPCPKNNVCQEPGSDSHSIGVCQPYYNTVKTLGDSCTSDIECDSNLKCLNSICSVNLADSAYSVRDKAVSRNYYYYCPNEYVPSFIPSLVSSSYVCNSKSTVNIGEKCYDKDKNYNVAPSFGKVCGKYNFDTSANNYAIKSIEMQSIGSVGLEEFVQDERACESGFALYFYPNKKTEQETGVISGGYGMCVNLIGAKANSDGTCHSFTYSLKDGKERSYLVSGSPFSHSYTCTNLMTKLELFKQFVEKKKSLGECSYDKKYLNEPFTCGRDELRELWAYYNHPEIYLLYKNEPAIYEYLIQTVYPDYTPGYTEPVNLSGYLSIKYLSLLILFLFL